MQQWNRGVVLNRKIAVWDGQEHAPSDTRQLVNEGALGFTAAHMLQYGVGAADIELAVPEGQGRVGLIWM